MMTVKNNKDNDKKFRNLMQGVPDKKDDEDQITENVKQEEVEYFTE